MLVNHSAQNGGLPLAKDKDVSIIICTRNRAKGLKEALQHWTKVNRDHLREIILVDNGSTDDTSDVIQSAAEFSDLPIFPVYEKKPGLAAARNAGIEVATGKIIGFTDDDCYPDPGYVTSLHTTFNAHPNISFLGGRILLHDPADLPITIKTELKTEQIRSFGAPMAGVIHGANMAMRRQALLRAGDFDECFGAGSELMSAEDTEMIARLCWCGFSGMYSPEPLVYHHHGRRTLGEKTKLLNGYAIGRGAYYMKYILNPNSRWIFVRSWVRQLLKSPSVNHLKEIKGAIAYLRVHIQRIQSEKC